MSTTASANGFRLANPLHFLALGFGAGLSPWAPGTAGTLVAIPLYLFASRLTLAAYILVVAAAFAFGIYCCGKAARDAGVHDHPAIVWDEIVGFFVTMAFVPLAWEWIVAGFVLFRLFDIVKPWPIGLLDRRVSGGLGIMLDDLVAGAFSAVLLVLAFRLLR